ncbi:ATP-dependent DNA helicase UvrD2 [Ruania alkalisoli]|uniref:DNA 3'-5' helicase n=1 Tax=Ruania alkalisoli TaxID=2779775 RepID=A0A7M1SWC7_9MICO|nr:ATP-dependent DNA helicase UvrD2 [Ruania alkalisoli]QOR71781.1 ATP-dependent DNA helicase UvrD2 [Ruania alkalisoli]
MTDPDQLLEALDPDQRAVAEQLTGPVCVLAGAGTGKTRAVTYRIAHGVHSGVYNPQTVLAVTFTARAAGEMRTRLRDLGVPGVQARTFHAAALRQLSYFWPSAIGGGVPRIMEHKAPLIGEAAGRLGLSVDRLAIRDLAAEVEWAKVSLVTADDYPRAAAATDRSGVAGFDPTTIARLLSVYEDAKTDRNVIDFEDVLLLTVGILAERADVAERVRRQYRHFVVDEFQDVSPLQHRLLELWLGGRDDLCVVGDAAQTIYSFTGATPRYLTDFSRRYPEATVVRLVRDYRSTPQVVSLANSVLAGAGRFRSAASVELQAQRPSGPAVRFVAHDDDEAEASAVAARAAELIRSGVPAAEIAVLYRTNGQSEAYEQALSRAGIGYLVRGGERFFSRKEVRDAVVLLRGAVRSQGETPLPDAVRDVLTSAGWAPEAPAARGAVRERWESLNALVQLADDLYAARQADMGELVAELTERAAAQHAPTVDGVTLASFHAAKGLEWDAVFLVGVSDGLLPISMAETEDAVAEERRLLYVGITRAREHLELSFARSRNAGGRGTRRPSRFLDGIWPSDERPARRRRGKAARAEALASSLTLEDADPEVFDRLRTWRAATAQSLDRPAFTVLHDSTLVAIAAARPTHMRQLAILRGIGPTKLEAYGAEILAVVRDDGGSEGPGDGA